MKRIGVLALQGAFSKHAEILSELGCQVALVKRPSDLQTIDGLIIPGGESTVMQKHLSQHGFREALLEFGASKPLFGTCAGAILMSSRVLCQTIDPFGFIDMTIERNGFGRQLDSFSQPLAISACGKEPMQALFIRAPRIKSVGKDVEVLSSKNGEPVLVRQGNHIAATFHPELTQDARLHKFFISILNRIEHERN